jgi:tetratricopeptide (TPR) repeat protein
VIKVKLNKKECPRNDGLATNSFICFRGAAIRRNVNQQPVAQKYAFSQIQNNTIDKASVENVETLLNKGRDLLNLGKYEEAVTYFDKALAMQPNNTMILKFKELALANANLTQNTMQQEEQERLILEQEREQERDRERQQ